MLGEEKPTDRDEYLDALAALPGSWEGSRLRPGKRTSKRKLAVKARKSARTARKRSRRKR